MSSLSTSLKNSYQKWLHPYEEYLRVVKPGVQQMLEFEHGGPFTPSPAHSPVKNPTHGTPIANASDSPAVRASVALNATLQDDSAPPPSAELPRPVMSSGFTSVNPGGFTAVNTPSQQASLPQSAAPSPFAGINTTNGIAREQADSRTGTPLRNGGSPMLSEHNTPDMRPITLGLTPLASGQTFNQLKRTLSQEAEDSSNGETDDANGRRSKRLKKGKHICACRYCGPDPLAVRTRMSCHRISSTTRHGSD
jgi:histone demethylase JARID1